MQKACLRAQGVQKSTLVVFVSGVAEFVTFGFLHVDFQDFQSQRAWTGTNLGPATRSTALR